MPPAFLPGVFFIRHYGKKLQSIPQRMILAAVRWQSDNNGRQNKGVLVKKIKIFGFLHYCHGNPARYKSDQGGLESFTGLWGAPLKALYKSDQGGLER
jgi:hypothetical protein